MNKIFSPLGRPQTGVLRRFYNLRETVMAYLPMIMLAVLFLFSVWLVRSVPRPQSFEPTAPPSHTADYDFQNFTLKSYEMNGKLKSTIHGAFAQHFQDTMDTEIKQPFVLIYSKDKVISVRGKKALVNEDGSQVQLMGQTLLKRVDEHPEEDDMQISGEFLHFFVNTDSLVSHLPVNIVRGKNRFKADHLDADNVNQVYQLKGRVHATLVPKPERP